MHPHTEYFIFAFSSPAHERYRSRYKKTTSPPPDVSVCEFPVRDARDALAECRAVAGVALAEDLIECRAVAGVSPD